MGCEGPTALEKLFPGQYHDAETGLNYNYFRTYNPATGRYTQSDPIGLRGGLNFYRYANASPLELGDMFGLKPGDLFKSFEAAAGDARRYVETMPYYEMVEYGGWFYQIDKCWSYNLIPGTPDHMNSGELEKIMPDLPIFGWHSHPGRGKGEPSQQVFSNDDKGYAKYYGVPEVLFPPDGGAVSYDPFSGETMQIKLATDTKESSCECQ